MHSQTYYLVNQTKGATNALVRKHFNRKTKACCKASPEVNTFTPSHLRAILDTRKNKLEASTSLQKPQVLPAPQEEAVEAPRAVLEPSRAIQKNVISSDPERSLITAVSINAPASTAFCPSTPSAMIKVTQIDL